MTKYQLNAIAIFGEKPDKNQLSDDYIINFLLCSLSDYQTYCSDINQYHRHKVTHENYYLSG